MSKLLKAHWDKLAFAKGNQSLNESLGDGTGSDVRGVPTIGGPEPEPLEQAQIEDAVYECFCDWLIRSPTPSRAGGDYFEDFVESVAKKLQDKTQRKMDRASLVDQLQNVMFQ